MRPKSDCMFKKVKLFGRNNNGTYLCTPKNKCRVGQGVKTPPFHGGITGSNPVRGTKPSKLGRFFYSLKKHDPISIFPFNPA